MNGLKLESKYNFEALCWIAKILQKNHVTWQISGGLAAKVYGSERPLMDIDIDIQNKFFSYILSDIKPYIISGPGRHTEMKWDFFQLARLDYKGQYIELCGSDKSFMFSQVLNKWVKYEVDFSTRLMLPIENHIFPVVNKNMLIKYKSQLRREVDLVDIEAALLNK